MHNVDHKLLENIIIGLLFSIVALIFGLFVMPDSYLGFYAFVATFSSAFLLWKKFIIGRKRKIISGLIVGLFVTCTAHFMCTFFLTFKDFYSVDFLSAILIYGVGLALGFSEYFWATAPIGIVTGLFCIKFVHKQPSTE